MNVKQAYRKALDTQETPKGSPVNLHQMAASIFHGIPYHAVTEHQRERIRREYYLLSPTTTQEGKKC